MRLILPRAALLGLGIALLASCSAASDTLPSASANSSGTPQVAKLGGEQQFPDMLGAELTPSGDQYTIAVTISSPYDTPERYTDGWRVLGPNGEVLSEHQLAHDHATEQPFTRTSEPFSIPAGVVEVRVEGHDQEFGYGGAIVTATVPQ